jgi:hypothetical protein
MLALVPIQEKRLLDGIGEENIGYLTYSHRVELLARDEDKMSLANKCIDEHLTVKQLRDILKKSKTKPESGDKIIGNPFIRDIITKYSKEDLSSADFTKMQADTIKGMQKKIDGYIVKVKNTQTKLSEIKKKLEPIYQEMVKAEKAKKTA